MLLALFQQAPAVVTWQTVASAAGALGLGSAAAFFMTFNGRVKVLENNTKNAPNNDVRIALVERDAKEAKEKSDRNALDQAKMDGRLATVEISVKKIEDRLEKLDMIPALVATVNDLKARLESDKDNSKAAISELTENVREIRDIATRAEVKANEALNATSK